MKTINEAAAGEFASHQGERLRAAKGKLEHNGYALDRRGDFEADAGDELKARASAFPGEWVLWDPNDDSDGFLLAGDDWESLYSEFISERGDWLEGGRLAAVSRALP